MGQEGGSEPPATTVGTRTKQPLTGMDADRGAVGRSGTAR